MLGPHLTLDLYGCDRKKLSDVDFIYKFLDEFPAEIGMRKIMPPYVFKYAGGTPEDAWNWGISGIVMIAESHISIHTWPGERYASIDVFSCKEFDIEGAKKRLIEIFGAKRWDEGFSMRGKEFPKRPIKAIKLIERQRISRF